MFQLNCIRVCLEATHLFRSVGLFVWFTQIQMAVFKFIQMNHTNKAVANLQACSPVHTTNGNYKVNYNYVAVQEDSNISHCIFFSEKSVVYNDI